MLEHRIIYSGQKERLHMAEMSQASSK